MRPLEDRPVSVEETPAAEARAPAAAEAQAPAEEPIPSPREREARRNRSAARTWLFRIAAIAAIIAVGLYAYTRTRAGDAAPPYRFVTIERGDVEYLVSSTGKLEPVTKVAVGTQVSGIISEILVDFNDEVQKGEIIAHIDPTLLESAVRDAQANLARDLAQLQKLESDYHRIEKLWKEELVSQTEYDTAKSSLEVGRETVSSSRIALERAKQNLSYTVIYAPISGTVIERNVDVGQTVAASFSAPQLFLIADDLTRMQILATVDESDIGRIFEGQPVRFTVQAYPDRPFEGRVRQVRLQSTVVENVVNYTVVVDVENSDRVLLPGMTATVDFFVEAAEDVLKVQNAALRFRPTPEMLRELRARSTEGRTGRPSRRPEREGARLWIVRSDGALDVLPVETGITDGQWTEISGEGLEEGMEVIAGIAAAEATGVNNPFGGTGPSPGGRPGSPRAF